MRVGALERPCFVSGDASLERYSPPHDPIDVNGVRLSSRYAEAMDHTADSRDGNAVRDGLGLLSHRFNHHLWPLGRAYGANPLACSHLNDVVEPQISSNIGAVGGINTDDPSRPELSGQVA
jgi:hypothetical protein